MRISLVVGACLVAGFLISPSSTWSSKDSPLKSEELVARHIASLGTPEARAAIKNRLIEGSAEVNFRAFSYGQLHGVGSFASTDTMTRLSLRFGHIDYPGEDFVWDGKRVYLATQHPGQWSDLGRFLRDYDFILKDGLLGGTMNLSWCLLGWSDQRAKLQYEGLKKVEGRQLHQLRYISKKGPRDVTVFLYFEPETFRHVMSQYSIVMSPFAVSAAGQQDIRRRFQEEFGNFKEADGITLPQSYKLVMTYEGGRQTSLTDWTFETIRVLHNQELDPATFAVR